MKKKLFIINFFRHSLKYCVGVALFFSSFDHVFSQTKFPYSNTLDGSDQKGLTIVGSNVQFTNGYLQLTPYSNGQNGFLIFNDAAFSSTKGIHIEFEFSSQGWLHDNATNGIGADGLSFFLYDAKSNIDTKNLPPTGGSLGYANSIKSSLMQAGVPGGYLSVGLDEFGNFKSTDGQKSGILGGNQSYFGNWYDVSFRNHVTLRGAAGKNFNKNNPGASATISGSSTDDNKWGYPLLFSASGYHAYPSGTSSKNYGVSLNLDASAQGKVTNLASADMATGSSTNYLYSYYTKPVNTTTSDLVLAGVGDGKSSPTWNPTDPDYRKAFIDIWPNTLNGVSGFNVNVSIQYGTQLTQMVKNFFYPSTTIKYADNGLYNDNSSMGKYVTIDATAPSNFSFGFSSSTGSWRNMHALHNLFISIPGAAIANPDETSSCLNVGDILLSKVLNNDQSYDNNSVLHTGAQYIDPQSFRFMSGLSTLADSTKTGIGTQKIVHGSDGISVTSVVYTSASGNWTYSTATQSVTYTRTNNYRGVPSALYSVKGNASNMNTEAYRSPAAILRVGLNGIQVTNDTATVLPPYKGANSVATDLNVLSNDTSYIYNSTAGEMMTTGASAIDKSSFYFTDANGGSNLGQNYSNTTTTGVNWSYDANTGKVHFTLTNKDLKGNTQAYYRVKTSDGCLSDVDTMTIFIPYSLPVTYASELSAYYEGRGKTQLQWTTAQELNNKDFLILRSLDAKTWSSIGTIVSAFPLGTSTMSHSYQYTDLNTPSGEVYYALQQEDLDGVSTISKIVSVDNQGNAEQKILVYPNPAYNSLNIAHASNGSTARVIAINGAIIMTSIIQNDLEPLNVQSLQPGLYILQIITKGGSSFSYKFIKK